LRVGVPKAAPQRRRSFSALRRHASSPDHGGTDMAFRGSISTAIAVLLASIATARAFDDAKYPDFFGVWRRVNLRVAGQPSFDQTKPWGRGQQAPLTPEYQAIHEASLADQANGGQGNWQSGARCMPPGMPASMNVYGEMEIVVLPEVTHVLLNHNSGYHRRIYTDGRDWPKEVEPSFQGYSIGNWIDADGSGRFGLLEVETRYFKGPRALDPTGLPVHADNRSIVKERIFFDEVDPTTLHDEITLIDHAYTRPWTVLKSYRRDPGEYPSHSQEDCAAATANMLIGKELYYLSPDRELMPTRKGQPPPDLSHFKTYDR
jgi:hypothetical protein